ncbi:MAG: hypothetical protein HQM02_07495, partial [Magnetococcales bacterium]|nr:hypothetical protein [Magnetococcales bacterium]
FAAADPALGVLDAQGFPVFLKDQTLMSFQGSARRFLISGNGGEVEFDADPSGQKRSRFVVGKLLLNGALQSKSLLQPRIQSEEIQVTGWWGDGVLMLNGQRLPLQPKEISHSLALDPRDRFFVLGTSFNLRFYAKNGGLRWNVATPGPVWAVNVTSDSQLIVAALGDGTIRWYDVMRGDERMALFIHKNQKQWAIWSPLKYYAASDGADTLIGWHINRGKNQLADFHPVAKFPQFLRPDFFKNYFP